MLKGLEFTNSSQIDSEQKLCSLITVQSDPKGHFATLMVGSLSLYSATSFGNKISFFSGSFASEDWQLCQRLVTNFRGELGINLST